MTAGLLAPRSELPRPIDSHPGTQYHAPHELGRDVPESFSQHKVRIVRSNDTQAVSVCSVTHPAQQLLRMDLKWQDAFTDGYIDLYFLHKTIGPP